ncbi:hypothetical protein [Sansalvadorimonas verongulae]|uniref:hypothetical protein n=1 Tax=Sansalvadorimonas verongulae TaxID=2172824 RepID=UPI0012BB8CF8|nr:hypothetical protein [Sansalvadorimonas verongulae]MTI14170.1 hypothetical protein [Sansalvadorimonas verongulae]
MLKSLSTTLQLNNTTVTQVVMQPSFLQRCACYGGSFLRAAPYEFIAIAGVGVVTIGAFSLLHIGMARAHCAIFGERDECKKELEKSQEKTLRLQEELSQCYGQRADIINAIDSHAPWFRKMSPESARQELNRRYNNHIASLHRYNSRDPEKALNMMKEAAPVEASFRHACGFTPYTSSPEYLDRRLGMAQDDGIAYRLLERKRRAFSPRILRNGASTFRRQLQIIYSKVTGRDEADIRQDLYDYEGRKRAAECYLEFEEKRKKLEVKERRSRAETLFLHSDFQRLLS